MTRLSWVIAGAIAIFSASIAYAGAKNWGVVSQCGPGPDPGTFSCSGSLGAARASSVILPPPKTDVSEAGCLVEPNPTGSHVECWVVDAQGNEKRCMTTEWAIPALSMMSSDSWIRFDVLVDPSASKGPLQQQGECQYLKIENSSVFQPIEP
jgi:hypothetical protein